MNQETDKNNNEFKTTQNPHFPLLAPKSPILKKFIGTNGRPIFTGHQNPFDNPTFHTFKESEQNYQSPLPPENKSNQSVNSQQLEDPQLTSEQTAEIKRQKKSERDTKENKAREQANKANTIEQKENQQREIVENFTPQTKSNESFVDKLKRSQKNTDIERY